MASQGLPSLGAVCAKNNVIQYSNGTLQADEGEA